MNKRLPTIGFTLLFIALAASNVFLIRQNFQMRHALERYLPTGPETGRSVPSFTTEGLDGLPIKIEYDGTGPKKVFLFFTPTCQYCRRQFAYWRDMLEHADRSRFEIIGIAAQTEDKARLSEYLRAMGCSEQSAAHLRVALATGDVLQSYKLTATPITVIINNDGRVDEAWTGMWNDADAAAAGAVFGFKIPVR